MGEKCSQPNLEVNTNQPLEIYGYSHFFGYLRPVCHPGKWSKCKKIKANRRTAFGGMTIAKTLSHEGPFYTTRMESFDAANDKTEGAQIMGGTFLVQERKAEKNEECPKVFWLVSASHMLRVAYGQRFCTVVNDRLY